MGYISADKKVHEKLNGVRIKVKKDFAEIDFWLSEVDDEEVLQYYQDWIEKVTGLDEDTPMEVIHFHSE